MKVLYIIFIALSPITYYAQLSQGNQGINSDPYQNAVILKHYSTADLNEIQEQDAEKWNKLIYYFTQSFIIDQIECDECLPFDITQFDITQFEHLRKKDSRVRKETKYGIVITLLSVDELEHKLPIHAPQIPLEDEEN